MHRSTTTATLLVTVAVSAVSALSGCMTVQRPPASGPPPAPSQPSAPRPDGRTEPQVVQAPAREALALITPSDAPAPTAPAPHHPTASPSSEPPSPASHPAPHQDHGKPHHPKPHVPTRPHVEIPDVSESVRKDFHKDTDVCALGRKYGGWHQDSPEATICRETYGR